MSQTTQEPLSLNRIRPRFKIETSDAPNVLLDKIRSALKKDSSCIGQIVTGYANLSLPKEEQHYWSPQLSLTIEESEGGEGSILRGLYGPRPAVWTMFAFFYSFIGFAILIVAMIGASFITIGRPAHILWLVPILIVVFLSLFLVARYGKKLGRDQMRTLHHFIEDCTGLTI